MNQEQGTVTIVAGTHNHLEPVLQLVHELAEFEKEADQVTVSSKDYKQGFDEGRFQMLVAEVDGEVVGMMVYYDTWSTWRGKMMYLEDFIVSAKYRSLGIGQKLMSSLRNLAEEGNYALIKWQVLNWNRVGIDFYAQMEGVEFEKNWWNVKVVF